MAGPSAVALPTGSLAGRSWRLDWGSPPRNDPPEHHWADRGPGIRRGCNHQPRTVPGGLPGPNTSDQALVRLAEWTQLSAEKQLSP